MKRIFAALLLSTLLLVANRAVQGAIVDDFTDTAVVTAEMGPGAFWPNPSVLNQTSLPGVLGGNRNQTVSVLGGSPQFGTARLVINAGNLSYSTDTGVTGTFALNYPVGPIDLSTSSYDFQISMNDNGGTFTLTLTDGSTTQSSNLIVGAGVTGLQSILIGGNPNFSLLNLNAITNVTFSFNSNLSTDIQLSNFGFLFAPLLTPEPASLAVWSMLIGLGAVVRRRTLLAKREA